MELFQEAAEFLNKHGGNLSADVKLSLYGLYKQSLCGPCDAEQPSLIDQVGRAKWDAWKACSHIDPDVACLKYVERVTEIFPNWEDVNLEDDETTESTQKNNDKGGFGPVFSSLACENLGIPPQELGEEPEVGSIHMLAREGDVAGVEKLLATGMDINAA
ncbi:hypothetical protein CYMTET_35092, partial [Cymbomonas tetramitiformis]